MQVDCALLCDSVTVREGLLHILGGGVTRLSRPGPFPAALGVSLALRILVHPTESASLHECRVLVQTTDGQPAAELRIQFQVPPDAMAQLEPGEELSLAVPMSLQGVGLRGPGAYSVEVLIDGIHQRSIPFVVQLAPLGSENPPDIGQEPPNDSV